MNHHDQLDQILEECLQDVHHGRATVADCLARYPEHRSDLEPLLTLAVALYQLPTPTPSADFRTQSPQRLMARLAPHQTATTPPTPTWWEQLRHWATTAAQPRWALGMASTAALLLLIAVVWGFSPTAEPNPVLVLPTPAVIAELPPTLPATLPPAATNTPSPTLTITTTLQTNLAALREEQTRLATQKELSAAQQAKLAADLDAAWDEYQTTLLASADTLASPLVQALATEALAAQEEVRTLQMTLVPTADQQAELRLVWASRALATAEAWQKQGQTAVAEAALETYTSQLQAWQALPTAQLASASWELAATQFADQYHTLQQFNRPALDQLWQQTTSQLLAVAPAVADQLPILPPGHGGANPGQGQGQPPANPPGNPERELPRPEGEPTSPQPNPPPNPPGQGQENRPINPPGQGQQNNPNTPPNQGGASPNPGQGQENNPVNPPGQGGENPGQGQENNPVNPPGQGGENPGQGNPPGQGGNSPGGGRP